jgi:adenylosuccinate lyase
MPHKRNPEACEQAVVMARLTAGLVPIALAAMSGDNERDSRSLRTEWVCVPDVSHYTLSATEIVHSVLTGLVVHVDRIRANADEVADQLATEGLMLALGRHVGKQTAHEHVYELSQAARRDGIPLRDLVRDHETARLLDGDELARIFDPGQYLGQSGALTRQVVTRAREWLHTAVE